MGLRPIHVYGATELYGPYMICERQERWAELPIKEQARLLARHGVHYLIADPVRVIDDQGREVPADGESLGKVLMRGNKVMTGYFEDPEQTRETLADGWYHSGDLAVRHPDGGPMPSSNSKTASTFPPKTSSRSLKSTSLATCGRPRARSPNWPRPQDRLTPEAHASRIGLQATSPLCLSGAAVAAPLGGLTLDREGSSRCARALIHPGSQCATGVTSGSGRG